jgi:hypothetical protein
MASHQTHVELSQSVPAEVAAGTDVIVRVKVSCLERCDLRGLPVRVMHGGTLICTSELATHHGAINETEHFAVKVPDQLGEYDWTILFPKHEIEGNGHEEGCLVVSFATRPHATSMAVWDVPSPVVMNRSFRLKVGVKCSTTCRLAGQLIEVRDDRGTQIGEGRLGEAPWPGTSALYVAEVELAAPATEATVAWSAVFAATPPGLPHETVQATFSFRTARPPEHRVTIQVKDKETEAPLEHVDVRLGGYRALTDAHGVASLELPRGTYSLEAWRIDYETLPKVVEVDQDLMIQLEAVCSPEKDPDDERVWM